MIDEIAVPDGLEQSVGKAERQDVLRRLLAEKMIDAKDLVLAEHLVQPRVERDRAREIGAERLFHDDARALDQTGIAQQTHRRQSRVRRNAQIVKPAALLAERLLRLDRLPP